jgi:hypothetical protein
MALKKKEYSSQTHTQQTVEKEKVGKREQPAAPVVCNDPLPTYTTTIEIPNGQAQAGADCAPPTPAQEGAALNMAKNMFRTVAAEYCEKGEESCPGEKKCNATVMITSVENQGVVSTLGAGGIKNCSIKFKITGSISCACS